MNRIKIKIKTILMAIALPVLLIGNNISQADDTNPVWDGEFSGTQVITTCGGTYSFPWASQSIETGESSYAFNGYSNGNYFEGAGDFIGNDGTASGVLRLGTVSGPEFGEFSSIHTFSADGDTLISISEGYFILPDGSSCNWSDAVTAIRTSDSASPYNLTLGQPIDGTLSKGEWDYFQVTGATLIELTTLSADLDLYVQAGSLPTLSSYDCLSDNRSAPRVNNTPAAKKSAPPARVGPDVCADLNLSESYSVGVYGQRGGSYTVLASSPIDDTNPPWEGSYLGTQILSSCLGEVTLPWTSQNTVTSDSSYIFNGYTGDNYYEGTGTFIGNYGEGSGILRIGSASGDEFGSFTVVNELSADGNTLFSDSEGSFSLPNGSVCDFTDTVTATRVSP